MDVIVTGSSGLIGSALLPALAAEGHRVTVLVRSAADPARGRVKWDPENGLLDESSLEGKDALIHLAGETISQRWTSERKGIIRESRVKSTRLLSERLGRVKNPPRVFISASAIGYYGDRGSETLTESSAPGSGFLAELCQEWEAAAEMAAQWNIRVVLLRTGIVLSRTGGALAKMLLPFRLGVGGRLGSGAQYMSWIDIEDAVGVILFALGAQSVDGPVNVVGPAPVTNAEFTKALGNALSRPAIFPVPAFAVELAFGEMGKELLLASNRVEPRVLQRSGFRFRYPQLAGALRHVLGK